MEEKLKKQIFEFIEERKSNLIEVLNVEERELEYVVDCVFKCADTRIPIYNTAGRKEQSCLSKIG